MTRADELTRLLTAFLSFEELIGAKDYAPTLLCVSNAPSAWRSTSMEAKELADLYDAEMVRMGDSRRAFRGVGAK